jgi:hypothetical protein
MIIVCAVFGGVEAAVIFAIRVFYPLFGRQTNVRFRLTMGSIGLPSFRRVGLAMIAAGLVPPYIDIYKSRRVRGFSFIFLVIDMSGAFFSLLSLCMLQ